MTSVGLLEVGEGNTRALEAIHAALEDTTATATVVGHDDADRMDVTVAVCPVSAAYDELVSASRGSDAPFVVVELGGVGGIAVEGVNASVFGATPRSACPDCLRRRVEASEPETDDGEFDAPTARFAGALAGHELASIVEGEPSQILGGLLEVPHAARRVLPVPFCSCAGSGGGGEGFDPAHEERTLEESISLAEVAFDERVGPISAVGEVESFPVPYYLATLAGTPFSDADAPEHAAGVGLDWDPAFMKALGEALERYSAAVYRTSSFETEPDAPIEPSRFVQPDETQEAIEYWHEAVHLDGGDVVQLPAELVVFPPPERRIRPAITTGLGLGNGGVDALLSGLYEVVERDAAMLAWYSTFEPLGLAVDDEGFETLSARAASEGLETTALLLTQDVDVPVVAACVRRDDDWPRFAIGSSADLDPGAAARGALEEAIQNWLELRRMGPDAAAEQAGAIGEYADLPERVRGFVEPETTIPVESVGPPDVPAGAAELDLLVERVSDAGLDAYAARLTPRDVEAIGFEAVRVVVPEAQPLFSGDPYFGSRARVVPGELGFEPRLERAYHPFP